MRRRKSGSRLALTFARLVTRRSNGSWVSLSSLLLHSFCSGVCRLRDVDFDLDLISRVVVLTVVEVADLRIAGGLTLGFEAVSGRDRKGFEPGTEEVFTTGCL